MKINTISIPVLALLAGWLSIMPSAIILAADSQQMNDTPGFEEGINTRSGSFDGYDKQSGRVWVNDMVFRFTDQTKVVGTASKLGLITDIEQGETVSLVFDDSGDNKPPMAVEIRRH